MIKALGKAVLSYVKLEDCKKYRDESDSVSLSGLFVVSDCTFVIVTCCLLSSVAGGLSIASFRKTNQFFFQMRLNLS